MNKNLILAASTIAVFGACSPVAPSVSKMSNAAAQKTNPTDGGNAPSPSTGPQTAAASRTSQSGSNNLQQMESHVISASHFARIWERARAVHVSFEIDGASLEELLRQHKASFVLANDKLKGREAELLKGKTRIHLVVDADPANITSMRLDEVRVSVTFKSALDGDDDHWELSIDRPKVGGKDPWLDISEAERILNDLQKHLKRVAIEFQPNA